ncbi:MAG TPA: hypothetical protein VGV12_04380 [Gemmatimonadales bacterium]|nr:hypothetical protein [Gemmatimonadales bacterium]
MDIEGVLAIVMLFGGGTCICLAFSPVGRAIAERIRRSGGTGVPEDVHRELDQLRSEVEGDLQQLRTEVGELSERMDFAERLLAKNREDQRIGPPKS